MLKNIGKVKKVTNNSVNFDNREILQENANIIQHKDINLNNFSDDHAIGCANSDRELDDKELINIRVHDGDETDDSNDDRNDTVKVTVSSDNKGEFVYFDIADKLVGKSSDGK